MEFSKIVQSRYAAKEFDGSRVDDAKVSKLIELIRLSPSSFNLQPWKLIVVSDAATKAKLSPAAWNQKQVTTCSHLLVLCADTNANALVDKLESATLASGASRESLAAYMKAVRGFASNLNANARRAWAQKQVYLALGNALNGAASLGLDSCPMEGFDPDAFARILGLPANLVPTVLVPIGHAVGKPRPKVRFATEDILYSI